MKKVFLLLMMVKFIGSVSAQVNPQTGSATFSLPMFNWQDDKSRLNSVVALNYNSGNGLKVNSVASSVGQGWSLVAGGFISRLQAGEPDDQKPRDGAVEDVSKYPPGYLYDPQSAKDGCPGALVKYPLFRDKNHIYKQHNSVAADKELDKFSFSFNGRTGVFVLDKSSNDKIVFLGDTNMKGWFVRDESMTLQGVRTTITAFYIQDENGLIYKFNQHERTKLLKVNYCGPNLTNQLAQPNFKSNRVYYENSFEDPSLVNPWIITGWYLTEIEDVLTHRKITFSYFNTNINAYAGASITHNATKNYSIVSHRRSITSTPIIASITHPDGHLIGFNYQATDRVDLPGDKALNAMTVTYNGRHLSKYTLTTSYLIQNRFGNPWTEFQARNARLYLLSVQKTSVDFTANEEPYFFNYYTGSGATGDVVPAPYSPYKDIWDYYNGTESKDFNGTTVPSIKNINDLNNVELKGLCYLRNGTPGIVFNTNGGYAKNGLLKQISYPTGGALEYEYEQNTYFDQTISAHRNVGGVHVSATKSFDGGYSNDCANKLISTYTYVTPKPSDPNTMISSLWGYETPDNSIEMSSYYNPESKYFYYKPPFSMGCTYRYQYPGILAKEQAISVPWGIQALQVLSSVMGIISPVLEVIDIIKLVTTGYWVNVVIDLVGSLVNIVLTCWGDRSKTINSINYYNADINASNPLPMQFKRVEVRDGSAGGVGATVMEFTSEDDYPIWELTNPSLSSKQRYAYWTYGLPKRTIIKDQSGNPVKETINTYNWWEAKKGYDKGLGYFSSCKCLVIGMVSQRSDDWSDPAKFNPPATPNLLASTSEMIVDKSQIYGGRVELEKTVERIYKQNSATAYSETETNYMYHYSNYLITDIYVKGSDGKTSFKKFTYSPDYSGGIFETFANANMVNVLVSTTTGFTIPGSDYTPILPGTHYVLNETVTEFAALSNGDIKPIRTLEKRLAQPASLGASYSPGTTDPAYKPIEIFSYDSHGNLITLKDEGNRTVTNIYDYKDKYVVASVINADAEEDKPAYESFETGDWTGSWALSGTPNFSTTNNITGKRSLVLSSSNTLTAMLNTEKPYRLSFWAMNTNFNISGNPTLITSGPAINGFTYYEYTLAAGPSSITISGGTTTIDELRLYPVNARMRTVTYDELIGKTSECDENNRITYYEYDDLARLRIIKDDRNNIVKMYEYNVAKSPVPCGGVFTHPAITEIFTKNCGAGYYSTEVVYTIPAGKYTSTVSQSEVDLAIENELNSASVTNYINANAQCLPLYANDLKTGTFTKEDCEPGYTGSTVTYTVAAGTYTSKVSKTEANELAQEEIDANGQAYANQTGTCNYSTTPEWIGTGNEYCSNGHKMVEVKDINPHSSSYNTTQWVDGGTDPSCPPVTCYMYDIIVPYSVASNLYIGMDICGGGSQLKSWAELDQTTAGQDATKITVCLSWPPNFRYGSGGDIVEVPQIQVVELGTCTP